jgi:ribose transport system ATP-binding protein
MWITAMDSSPLLRMEGITKTFSGIRALDHVNFDLRAGEVHVLLGENGAGKSTLIKILAGAYLPDSGKIFINGKHEYIDNPYKASILGINVIYQELSLVKCLSVVENIFLGKEPTTHYNLIDRDRMYSESKEVLTRIHCNIDPWTTARKLSIAELQMVEIAKALLIKSKIIVMDEPTSSLSAEDIKVLFEIIRKLKIEGVGIIYISHRLEEIKEIGDRVTVLRDAKYIGTRQVAESTIDELIKMMVGREFASKFPYRKRDLGEIVLNVQGLTRQDVLRDVNFSLRKGEILGISGLVGSGRTELARAIIGADPMDGGKVMIEGENIIVKSPLDTIQRGIGLLPEDRKTQGVALVLPVNQNITLVALKRLLRGFLLSLKVEKMLTKSFIEKLDIATPSLNRKVMYLSGGNQQKVVLAKWLCSQAKILIFDEPTRGIDVGAKHEIYQLMLNLADEGTSIIMISSELPEILGMSDRILVMRRGRITAELLREEATQEKILRYAMVDGSTSLN